MFKGKPWSTLTFEVLDEHSFSFLSPVGFRYYLPAYLFMALDAFRGQLPFTVHGLCWLHSNEADSLRLLRWRVEHFSLLNLAQRHAHPIDKRSVYG